jgi:CPA1 family monovalent cation:H+ antiporter
MHFEFAFVLLFAVATAVALVARWLRIPYTVALVVAGLALGSAQAFDAPHLTKELLFAVFLPGLLFEAAFHLEFRRFWQNKLAIHALAIPGVAAAIALTAVLLTPVADALHFVDDFNFDDGFLFAALIAATDPIAVVGLFKSLGAPKRLAILIEGESLLNDGTAVVLFVLILGVVTGGKVSVGGALVDFVTVVGVGMLIGAAIGFAASQVIRRVDDPMIEITLTTIAAYGSFLTAEHLHYSGVIATVVAGMLCGNYAARVGMSPSTRVAVESFWEYVAFALNSIIFLLIGLQVNVESLLASWQPILVAFVAVLVARAAVVYATTALLRRTRERIPWSWSAVLTWGGLRGGLSMVLVLGLPASFAHRDLLINMTFGVVILSILIQGLTMSPLLRRLRVVGRREDRHAFEVHRGASLAARAALGEIEKLAHERTLPAELLEPLASEYRAREEAANESLRSLHLAKSELREEELHAVRRHLLLAEKDAVIHAHHQGFLGQEAESKLLEEIDARLFRLEAGETPEPARAAASPEPPAAPEPPRAAAGKSG